jgi:hypothetical protein
MQFLELKRLEEQSAKKEKQKMELDLAEKKLAYDKQFTQLLDIFKNLQQEKQITRKKSSFCTARYCEDNSSSSEDEETIINHQNDQLDRFSSFNIDQCMNLLSDPNLDCVSKIKLNMIVADISLVNAMPNIRKSYIDKAIPVLEMSVTYLLKAATIIQGKKNNTEIASLYECIQVSLYHTQKILNKSIAQQTKKMERMEKIRELVKQDIILRLGSDAWFKNSENISKKARLRQLALFSMRKLYKIKNIAASIHDCLEKKGISEHDLSSVQQELKRDRSVSVDSCFSPTLFQKKLMETNECYVKPTLFKPKLDSKRGRSVSVDSYVIRARNI